MNTKQLEQDLSGMWATRPIRPVDERTIAGVCRGIADRYRVDPTLVKVAFVVAALFGGSGVILYIIGWVGFPSAVSAARRAGTAPQPPQRSQRTGNAQIVLIVVLVVLLTTALGPNTWGSGGIVGLILMGLAWWLLYRRTPQPPPGTDITSVLAPIAPPNGQFHRWQPRSLATMPPAAPTPGHPMPWAPAAPSAPVPAAASSPTASAPTAPEADTTPDTDTATETATPPSGVPTQQSPSDSAALDPPPPSWDPLGAARFAWDLPEPAAETAPEPVKQARSPFTLVVAGLALLVGTAGFAAHQAGIEWFTIERILSLSLAVIGAGLVLGSLRRRQSGRHSTGLVPIAALLATAVIATTAIAAAGGAPNFAQLTNGGVGERQWTPLSQNDIRSEYQLGIGSTTLDLRQVDLTRDQSVELRTGIGEIIVLVPADMNYRTVCDVGIGQSMCTDGLSVGSGGADAPVLTINAETGVGNVEVRR